MTYRYQCMLFFGSRALTVWQF